jgi:DNA-binding MarR family transcriptional regulator
MQNIHEEAILRSLRRIQRANELYSRQLAQSHNLTGPQLLCLRFLKSQQQSTASAMAREISVSQATMTGILDRLERRDLVLRQRCTEDKRRVWLRLTPQGHALISMAPSGLQQGFLARLGQLPPQEQVKLRTTLEQIASMMEAPATEAPLTEALTAQATAARVAGHH